MKLQRSVECNAAPATVFAYLSDFTNTTEWDPGTVRTERVAGEGGVGTRYHNVSKFLGRETELDYLVVECVPGERFALRGENATVVAKDTMTFVRTVTGSGATPGEGTTVTYRADFEFKGLAKFIAPLFAPAFKKLGDEAEQGMRDALGRLG